MREEIDYIYGIPKFVKKASLENTAEMLRRLGNPEKSQKIIHVAGTNGKGSVCAYLDNILQAEGYRVGRFTSPHLVDIRERICVNGEMISEERFEEAFRIVKQVAVEMERDGFMHPSFFEFLFGMAMWIFGGENCDYLILEVGLGGRLDATNVIRKPVLCVITSISLDHTEILGDTCAKIAAEKAGIMKPGVPVVFEDAREDVSRVLFDAAARMNSPVVSFAKEDVAIACTGDNFIDFSLSNGYYTSECFRVCTRGLYQPENASLVLLACRELGITNLDHIRRGLAGTRWIGRMQQVEKDIVIDGAHNEDGVDRFLESVAADGRANRVLLFSAVCDKHYDRMIQELCRSGLFAEIDAAVLADGRALSREAMEETFAAYPEQKVYYHDTVREALASVRHKRDEGNMVYVAGSLYLAGEVLSYIGV